MKSILSKGISIRLALLLGLFLLGCQEEKGPFQSAQVSFEIVAWQLPAQINIASNRAYTVAAKIRHPGGPQEIREAWAIFSLPDSSLLLAVALYDDGGALFPNDGDVVARDSIFTGRFETAVQNIAAGTTIRVQFKAVDSKNVEKLSETYSVQAVVNTPPRIVSIQLPDTFPSGTAPIPISARVEDDEGFRDVRYVLLRLVPEGQVNASFVDTLFQMSGQTNTFGKSYDSTLAAEKIGNYQGLFQAFDQAGDTSSTVAGAVYFQNEAPELFRPQLPDTFKLPNPAQQTDTMHVSIRVKDPQGLGDVDSVYFQTLKPNGQLAGGGTKFLLFDNGDPSHGDEVADDGRFSEIISISSSNETGRFIFLFKARDRVKNTSATVQDSIQIVP